MMAKYDSRKHVHILVLRPPCKKAIRKVQRLQKTLCQTTNWIYAAQNMNSYPPELLTQLAPIMFVAGLDPANVVHSPINSPSTPTPQSATTPTQASKDQDQFAQLIHRLRDALSSQRKVAVWQPEKSNTFQIVLVDKDTQFPPRKVPVNFSEDGASPGLLAHGGQVMHSPLSPLTPTSPLCPDGLIAPIWIRKHTTLVPSVFVLFLRIYEYPLSTPKSPLEPMEIEREREREAEERRRDTELAAEVAMKKRSTNERGIKLTVVLIASRKLLGMLSVCTYPRLLTERRQTIPLWMRG